ncbi:type IV pilus assembly protein PilM [Aquipuribacter nitratireducens]|uniref:Type IV pilus assembly protein PilM n=1 Tax=Aquipuribacter nitratireducens TaxID=650104 RepID=A0ABW0GR16_9MICO
MAARTAIGLDIGTSGVRAAELTFGRHGVRLEKFGQVAVPAGAVRDGEVVEPVSVAEAIKELWGATRFSSKQVVLGVANQRVVVRNVELPWLPVAELRKSLGLQVADLLPMPVEQAVLDFHPVEEVRGDRGRMIRGMLVAASRDVVLANVRCAERAGLTPTSVDLTSFAVLRSLGSGAFGDGATEALIDVGARVTNIVVHTAGVPTFVRILLMGGQDITDALAERVGSSLAEAEGLKHVVGMDRQAGPEFTNASRAVEATAQSLVDEIRGSLDYYSSTTPGAPVERVVVSGGGSLLRGLTDRLGQAVRVPVEVGDPMKDMSIGKTGLDDDQLALVRPLAAVPVGLAMGAAR